MMPIIIAMALSPGTLKTGFMKRFNDFPRICMKFVLHNNSVATKNGNRVGTTEFAHKIKPFLAASRFDAENKIRLRVNSKKSTVKKYFLIEITMNRIISSIILGIYAEVKKIEQEKIKFFIEKWKVVPKIKMIILFFL